jgi:DNA polymerase I-like protein with 3'-5' exonuclease and polymerase domains
MGLFYILTSADTQQVKKTFGVALSSFRPDIPKHKVLQFYAPEEGEAEPDFPTLQQGDMLLIAGMKAFGWLQRTGRMQKNRTLTSQRGKVFPVSGGGSFMLTFDPGVVNSEPHQQEVLAWDLRLAVRFLKTHTLMPPLGNYKWVNTFQPVIDYIEKQFEKTGRAVAVSTDLETEGFHPFYPDKDIVSISFTCKAGESHLLYTGRQKPPVPHDPTVLLFDQINWLLTSPKVKLRLANGKFDMGWIYQKWGLECTNFNFDTLLAGSLVNENRSNSLNLHAKIFTDIGGYDDPFNAKYDKGKMGEITNFHDLAIYAGGDTDACQQSADVLVDQLAADEQLLKFYVTVVHPAARAFEKVERRGVLVDQQKFALLRTDLDAAIKEAEKEALTLLPNKMKMKYIDKIDRQLQAGKSPLLATILKDYFFSPYGLNLKPLMWTPKPDKNGDKVPSTAKAHLRMFEHVPDAVAMVKVLSTMDSASKTRSTFVDGFLNHLRPDGRLHPSYMLFHGGFNDDEDDESGSVTGRLSAKDPAFQTVPKKTFWAKRLRECYIAPPGKVILALDYSQGELRVVACIAPEPTMIEAYKQGLDLHAVTGASIADIDLALFMSYKDNEDAALKKIYDDARDRAKPANFGLLYAMSAEGFVAYAWAAYGRKFTLAEATAIREAFFALYPGLLKYHDRMKLQAKLQEFVRSPLGRVRHLPHIKAWDQSVRAKAERQAINSPVQATLTDMMIWAIALLEDAYPNGEFEIFGVVHDQVLAYIDADKIDLRTQQAKEIMQNLPFDVFGWAPQLSFPADAEAGIDLAHLNKVKLAA